MEPALIERLGDELHAAWTDRRAIEPLTNRHPDMSIEDAYHVQRRMMGRRLDAGARVVGKKIGVTSQAVMDMLGVYQPDFGYLLSDMVVAPGEAISMAGLIQPKAEGEIAFVLKKALRGPGVTVSDVLAATEAVTVCFEIVDSRIRDWKIRIQDTVADNASCGVFVLGDRLVSPRGLDLRTCGMVFEKNGELLGTVQGVWGFDVGRTTNAILHDFGGPYITKRDGDTGAVLASNYINGTDGHYSPDDRYVLYETPHEARGDYIHIYDSVTGQTTRLTGKRDYGAKDWRP